jgi:hypothetical protein
VHRDILRRGLQIPRFCCYVRCWGCLQGVFLSWHLYDMVTPRGCMGISVDGGQCRRGHGLNRQHLDLSRPTSSAMTPWIPLTTADSVRRGEGSTMHTGHQGTPRSWQESTQCLASLPRRQSRRNCCFVVSLRSSVYWLCVLNPWDSMVGLLPVLLLADGIHRGNYYRVSGRAHALSAVADLLFL